MLSEISPVLLFDLGRPPLIMECSYLKQLPSWLVDIVIDTEKSIGFPIEVRVNRPTPQSQRTNRTSFTCNMSAYHARIITPSVGLFSYDSVFHELLHIRRHLVNNIPRLAASENIPDGEWSPLIEDCITAHDNALEHLAIVPIEINKLPSRREYWENKIKPAWPHLATASIFNEEVKHSALAEWIFLRHVFPESPQITAAYSALASLGLKDKADEAFDRLPALIIDKVELTRTWIEICGFNKNLIDFEYLDPARGTTTRRNL